MQNSCLYSIEHFETDGKWKWNRSDKKEGSCISCNASFTNVCTEVSGFNKLMHT